MVCQKCKTQSVYEFTNKAKLCKQCFAGYFEKKIFRTIRKYEMSLSSITGDKNDVRHKILKIILNKIKINRKSKNSASIKNLNDFSTEIISSIMAKNIPALKKSLPKTKTAEFPLYFTSDREIMLYAGLKRIKGSIKRKENKMQKEINSLFNEIENNDRDVRHAVVNAMAKI